MTWPRTEQELDKEEEQEEEEEKEEEKEEVMWYVSGGKREI